MVNPGEPSQLLGRIYSEDELNSLLQKGFLHVLSEVASVLWTMFKFSITEAAARHYGRMAVIAKTWL